MRVTLKYEIDSYGDIVCTAYNKEGKHICLSISDNEDAAKERVINKLKRQKGFYKTEEIEINQPIQGETNG